MEWWNTVERKSSVLRVARSRELVFNRVICFISEWDEVPSDDEDIVLHEDEST